MAYGTRRDVEYYGQFTSASFGRAVADEGYTYTDMIVRAIESADRAIDAHLDALDGFFEGGGVEITNELHDGMKLGYHRLYPSYGLLGTAVSPKMRLNHVPVRSIVSVEENTSGTTWTSRTEGRSSDFVVTSEADGIRWLRNIPGYEYASVRVTYVAGYAVTPPVVVDVSGRLAGAMLRKILDAEKGNPSSVGNLSIQLTATLSDTVFTPALKTPLKRLKHHTKAAII